MKMVSFRCFCDLLIWKFIFFTNQIFFLFSFFGRVLLLSSTSIHFSDIDCVLSFDLISFLLIGSLTWAFSLGFAILIFIFFNADFQSRLILLYLILWI